MSGIFLFQFVLVGLSMGAVYALIALGFMTIFRASNIVNFAQGEFVMMGGLLTDFFIVTCHLSYLFSAVLGVLGVILLGMGLQVMVINPIRRSGVLIMIMCTLGASTVISNIPIPISRVRGLRYLGDSVGLPKIIAGVDSINFAGVGISVQRLLVIGACLVLLGLLYYFSHSTRIGKAMESSASDSIGAQLSGIRVERMVLYSFVISAAVGALGGVLITPILNMRYDSGAILGLKGFTAAVIGGWGKVSGAVLGGFVLGVVESVCVGAIPEIGSLYQHMWAFLILIGILYFRPKGILGSEAVE
jgi:branched-chain amino acid transport system permease protein